LYPNLKNIVLAAYSYIKQGKNRANLIRNSLFSIKKLTKCSFEKNVIQNKTRNSYIFMHIAFLFRKQNLKFILDYIP